MRRTGALACALLATTTAAAPAAEVRVTGYSVDRGGCLAFRMIDAPGIPLSDVPKVNVNLPPCRPFADDRRTKPSALRACEDHGDEAALHAALSLVLGPLAIPLGARSRRKSDCP